MKQGQDITASFPDLFIIHQKLRGNAVIDHSHDDHEMFLPLQGEIRISVGDKLLKAGPGKMIYLPPGLAHSFQADAHAQGERLIFMASHALWKACEGPKLGPLVVSASQLSKELLFHLLLHPKTKAAKPLIETLVQTIIEGLEEAGTSAGGDFAHLTGRASDARLKRALSRIEKSYSEAIPMSELARESGLSLRNLNRLFLSELGLTPKQALTLCRIDRARKLLRDRKLSVTDISFEVGYNSVSQFITTFRKVTGQLPSELR